MPPNNEEKPAKIDELMSEIDLTKPFLNTTSGEKYEIGEFVSKFKNQNVKRDSTHGLTLLQAKSRTSEAD